MRGKAAKVLRRAVYGEDYAPRHREMMVRDHGERQVKILVPCGNTSNPQVVVVRRRTIYDVGRRGQYQRAKKAYTRLRFCS